MSGDFVDEVDGLLFVEWYLYECFGYWCWLCVVVVVE